MKKQLNKIPFSYMIYIAVSVAALLLCAFAFSNPKDILYTRGGGSVVEKLTVTPSEKDGYFEYSFTLPSENVSDRSVAFHSAHFDIEIFIDGEPVFRLQAGDPDRNKSSGFYWNFIRPEPEDAGKTLSIRWIPAYAGLTPKDTIYLGNEIDIYRAVYRENGLRLILAVVILMIGIELLVYSACTMGKTDRGPALLPFSVFSILLAGWTILESPLCNLITMRPVESMLLDHYVLMLMPIPFTMFIRHMFTYRDHPLWDFHIILNAGIVLIRTLLQVTSVLDIKQTLWMTHIAIILLAVTGVSFTILDLRLSGMTRQMKTHLICILFIFVSVVLELALFQFFHKSSIWSMIGFATYILVMSLDMIRKSQRTAARAREAELYRKLAYTDELTGVYNRTAFRHDMDDQIQTDQKTGERVVNPLVVFMFDLNDLKRCNDNFGHENGDRYIRMVSDALTTVFGIDGRCYRIGGDEFCVLMPGMRQIDIDGRLNALRRYIRELNRKGFVVPVSVAAGYAVYDQNIDQTPDDTMKRADAAMYQNKQAIKQSRHSA
ncbi:MAG: GGDEF domain-containing protein [Clostridium sp.]|nr:GGDEF domain-containing protein [Acetatifactor muris]MCM1528330.1 GGDEF domain-containing protein [Bacteroides sp.]MCM1563905.1 GGDEF domain-containing protein [Clostridium sp.]